MDITTQFNQDIIALIWDFDKTLIPEYSQKPLFDTYGIDPHEFWEECNAQYEAFRVLGAGINRDTYYLNHILRYVEAGRMPGLSLRKLAEIGQRIELFEGLPDFFVQIREDIENRFSQFDVKLEHYIVSTGMRELIRGSAIAEHVKDIWSCEFLQHKFDPERKKIIESDTIVDIGYTLDNTSKTRAIFEINKGVNVYPELSVNQAMPEEDRRIPVANMIYIADGPSDIPAFSVVRKGGGKTLAVYKEGDVKSFRQAKKLLDDDRVDYFSKANYTRDSTTYEWLFASVSEIAERIAAMKRARLNKGREGVPGHLV